MEKSFVMINARREVTRPAPDAVGTYNPETQTWSGRIECSGNTYCDRSTNTSVTGRDTANVKDD